MQIQSSEAMLKDKLCEVGNRIHRKTRIFGGDYHMSVRGLVARICHIQSHNTIRLRL
jgi:hypothetical protein